MSTIPILPSRLYTLTLFSAFLSFVLLLHTTSFLRYNYYGWTEFICRISLTYYTVCLLASSRIRPSAFGTKWSIGIASGIVFLFTALIYESVPDTIREVVNRINGTPTYGVYLWKLAVVSGLELLQVVVCGVIFQRSLEDQTWAEEGSISLGNDEESGAVPHVQQPASGHSPVADASVC